MHFAAEQSGLGKGVVVVDTLTMLKRHWKEWSSAAALYLLAVVLNGADSDLELQKRLNRTARSHHGDMMKLVATASNPGVTVRSYGTTR